MKYRLEFEMEEHHCLHCICIDRSEADNCKLQIDEYGDIKSFEDWKEQMTNCPLQVVFDVIGK